MLLDNIMEGLKGGMIIWGEKRASISKQEG